MDNPREITLLFVVKFVWMIWSSFSSMKSIELGKKASNSDEVSPSYPHEIILFTL